MGNLAVTAKLLSQTHAEAKLDWRKASLKVPIEPAQLPDPVDRACRTLMKRLGIVFGCFDFIVTPDGEYIFLELNEMGQFLWIEDLNPDFKLLDCFCEFLTQKRSADFSWKPSSGSIAFHDLLESAEQQQQRESSFHVPKPSYYVVNDDSMSPHHQLAQPAYRGTAGLAVPFQQDKKGAGNEEQQSV